MTHHTLSLMLLRVEVVKHVKHVKPGVPSERQATVHLVLLVMARSVLQETALSVPDAASEAAVQTSGAVDTVAVDLDHHKTGQPLARIWAGGEKSSVGEWETWASNLDDKPVLWANSLGSVLSNGPRRTVPEVEATIRPPGQLPLLGQAMRSQPAHRSTIILRLMKLQRAFRARRLVFCTAISAPMNIHPKRFLSRHPKSCPL